MKFLPCLLAFSLTLGTGCALLPHRKSVVSTTAQTWEQAHPSPSPKHRQLIPHFSLKLPFFHHAKSPPRAQMLQKVGTVRTISADGTYLIAELEPGTLVVTGRELVITAAAGEPIRLKVAEIEPPYFIADIKSGLPSVGQSVFQ